MSEQPPPLARSLRGLAATLLGLAQVRLELLSVEAREEALRLGEILLYGAIALTMLSVGVAFLAIFLTVLLWDSHRLLALAVFATLFVSGGIVAAWVARDRVRQGSRLFAESIRELQKDRTKLEP
ncbi:MAG: phage holin family protein [Burkholderiaceae bacterium]|nr:phage holin family protein [Burkholderiaceae bacterium]